MPKYRMLTQGFEEVKKHGRWNTWKTIRKTCRKCGNEYELRCQRVQVKNKDSISCDICGAILIKWNESEKVIWTSFLRRY